MEDSGPLVPRTARRRLVGGFLAAALGAGTLPVAPYAAAASGRIRP